MPLKEIKIVFFGTPNFAKDILAGLIYKRIPVGLVVAQPDKPAGRGQKTRMTPVKKYALERGLKLRELDRFGEKELAFFEKKKPDIIITAAYGKILPSQLLKIPRYGAINVHASLLPSLRGPSPIQKALLNGNQKTGVTVMLMNERMDEGDILAQKEVDIDPDEKYPELENKLAFAALEILPNTLKKWVAREIKPIKQESSLATYSHLIEKKDGLINWKKSAQEIYNQYRAYCLWPKVYSYWKKKKLVINEMNYKPEITSNTQPGTVVKANGGAAIATKSGVILPRIVQLENKKETPIEAFLNGHPDFIGSQLGQL